MRQITEEQVEAFRARLRATDHAPGRWPITAGIWPALPSGWGERREAAPGAAAAWRSHLLERGYTPGTINTMLVVSQQVFRLSRLERLPGEDFENPAAAVSGGLQELTREEYQRLIAAAQSYGQREAHALDGDHLLHGDPGQRSEVYHRGSSQTGEGGDLPEGGKFAPSCSPTSCAGSY